MRNIFGVVLFLISSIATVAQANDSAKLKVFMDCRTGCDMHFIKTEMHVVYFETNRRAADAHVLIKTQRVGSGATKYQLNFYDQNLLKKFTDTVQFKTSPPPPAD